MRNSLYFIGLASLIISCGSQKEIAKPNNLPQPATSTIPNSPKSEIKHDVHGDYFTVNIADPTKNDNTISYGSLVGAKPEGYKVTRNHFPAIAQNFRQKYVILHYTALDHDKSVRVLTTQAVSSHYLVNDSTDIEIYQLVDENKRSYHAGISSWRKDATLNDTSIGIEIVNEGFKVVDGKRVFVSFPEHQVKKVAALVQDIVKRYQIPPTNVLAHSDIAPTRKQDPGPLFPWKKLYDEYGIGMWYDDATVQSFQSQIIPEEFNAKINDMAFVMKVQIALKQFGYGVTETGVWDDATKKTIEAFQYHFRPQNYDGKIDIETWAILQALIQKYPNK
ncbi:N-acetylmuramoyl-L-alanine amidase [Cloacibacterium normanense]|uniref:N-acetylmuramoyl-L-alanine amidase n=1 Tax=Cloacibacterium normanense TaxID=237258 RepID=UPI0035B21DCE